MAVVVHFRKRSPRQDRTGTGVSEPEEPMLVEMPLGFHTRQGARDEAQDDARDVARDGERHGARQP